MKNILIILFALITQLIYSNTKRANDSLAKLGFEDIRLRIVESMEDEKLYKFYVDYYTNKAKKDKDIEYLIKGYGFKVEGYPMKEALKNADSMLYLIKDKKPNLLFLYYYKIGNLYSGSRKNRKALDNYLLAYKHCPKSEETYYNAIKMQIGVIRSTLGQDREAIPMLKETEDYFREKSPKHYLFEQYVMAEIYNSLLELETAKEVIDKGLVLSKEMKSDFYYDRFLGTKGVNLYSREEYRQALNVLLPILKNAEFVREDFSDYALISYYIGKSYEGLKNRETALKYFKKVDSILVTHKDVYSLNIDAYKSIIDYYKDKGDLRNQLLYTERLIVADSLLMTSNEYGLKNVHKHYDIPNLISDKQTIITQLKRKETFTNITIFLLFIIIVGLAFVYYRNKKRNREKIELLKSDLEQYLAQQNKNFEDKNKFSISEERNLIDSPSNQGKMSDETKNSILDSLSWFENNKDFLKNNCSLENLAKEFNTNKTYLSKVINEDKGYTFSTYVSNLRINYLIETLKEDKRIRKYSIESIAEEIGYNNVKAFNNAFYERIGVKPSVFIKNSENKS